MDAVFVGLVSVLIAMGVMLMFIGILRLCILCASACAPERKPLVCRGFLPTVGTGQFCSIQGGQHTPLCQLQQQQQQQKQQPQGHYAPLSFDNPCYESFDTPQRRKSEELLIVDSRPASSCPSVVVTSNVPNLNRVQWTGRYEQLVTSN